MTAQEMITWVRSLAQSPERDAVIATLERQPLLEATRQVVETRRATQDHFNRRNDMADESGYLTREQFSLVSDELDMLVKAQMTADEHLLALEAQA